MLGVIAAILLLGLSAWIVLGTICRFHRLRVTPRWWVAFAVMGIIGAISGIWVALSADYHVSATVRFLSFPIPIAFFVLEEGRWTDFVPPPLLGYAGLFVNTTFLGSLALLPLLGTSFIIHRRSKSDAPATC